MYICIFICFDKCLSTHVLVYVLINCNCVDYDFIEGYT